MDHSPTYESYYKKTLLNVFCLGGIYDFERTREHENHAETILYDQRVQQNSKS